MNVLVTGGGGFLGSAIIDELLGREYKVFNLSRNSYPELEAKSVTCLRADISSKEEVQKLDFKIFDCVFHVAAKAGVWGKRSDYININFEGSKNIFDHAKKSGVKYIIYTSSPSAVFGWEDINGSDESLPYPETFSSYYGESKALAEQYILEQAKADEAPKTIALRPHLIWGPGDPHIFPRILEKAKTGKLKTVGDGQNLVDIIHVKNAAVAHLQALDAVIAKPELSGNVYFLGQSEPVNLWDFISQILRMNKIDPIESSISFRRAFRIGSILEKVYRTLGILKPEPPMTRFMALQLGKSHYFSHAKAIKDLKYNPQISTQQGLDELYQNS